MKARYAPVASRKVCMSWGSPWYTVACQLAHGIGRRWSSEIDTSGTSG